METRTIAYFVGIGVGLILIRLLEQYGEDILFFVGGIIGGTIGEIQTWWDMKHED